MDSLPKDVVIYLFQFLDAESLAALNRVGRRYSLYSKSDLIWRRLVVEEFGAVEKTDINPIAETWFVVYRTFRSAFNAAHDGIHMYHYYRKVLTDDMSLFQAFLFRRPERSMIIPDTFISPQQSKLNPLKRRDVCNGPWINPRRGDTIIELREIGYRNDGISYWNGKERIQCCYEIDDYGSTPLEFAYPEFPPRYFYAGHGDHCNVLISQAMIDQVLKTNTLTLGSIRDVIGIDDWSELKVGVTFNYCSDTGDYYFADDTVSMSWRPRIDSEDSDDISDDE